MDKICKYENHDFKFFFNKNMKIMENTKNHKTPQISMIFLLLLLLLVLLLLLRNPYFSAK